MTWRIWRRRRTTKMSLRQLRRTVAIGAADRPARLPAVPVRLSIVVEPSVTVMACHGVARVAGTSPSRRPSPAAVSSPASASLPAAEWPVARALCVLSRAVAIHHRHTDWRTACRAVLVRPSVRHLVPPPPPPQLGVCWSLLLRRQVGDVIAPRDAPRALVAANQRRPPSPIYWPTVSGAISGGIYSDNGRHWQPRRECLL